MLEYTTRERQELDRRLVLTGFNIIPCHPSPWSVPHGSVPAPPPMWLWVKSNMWQILWVRDLCIVSVVHHYIGKLMENRVSRRVDICHNLFGTPPPWQFHFFITNPYQEELHGSAITHGTSTDVFRAHAQLGPHVVVSKVEISGDLGPSNTPPLGTMWNHRKWGVGCCNLFVEWEHEVGGDMYWVVEIEEVRNVRGRGLVHSVRVTPWQRQTYREAGDLTCGYMS